MTQQPASSPNFPPALTSPEGEGYLNSRGEIIHPELVLTVDPVRGETWSDFARQGMPAELFQHTGLATIEGSDKNVVGTEEFANVVEHTMVVVGACLTAVRIFGGNVNETTVEHAAWGHDATKRGEVREKISREDEAASDVLERVLGEFGFTDAEIAAAKNTGRLYDRFLTNDPVACLKAIKARSPEENLVGYMDARTRGARFMTLEEARIDSIKDKPESADFFNDNWGPYYTMVEQQYLPELLPGFDPSMINDDTIYATIEAKMQAQAA
jgi:hypothetical protein